MNGYEIDTTDFSKHYQIDSEGFVCFVSNDGKRTRIARILRNGDIEAVGKTRISDQSTQKKRHFWVKTFILLFFMLAAASTWIIFHIYEKSAKLSDDYLSLSVKYSDAVSEVVSVCKSELKKIENFINDSEDHSEEEIEELIRKLKGISPNYCQRDPELYPKFSELSKALYVMKGKIGGKREAEEKQRKELEQQEELERQRELERQQEFERQQELEQQRELERQKELKRQKELEQEIAEMKQREAERKKNEEKAALQAEREKREKEAREKKNNGRKGKTKNAGTIKKTHNSGNKKNGEAKKTVKKAEPERVSETPKEDAEETSRIKQGIDKLEEWLKNLQR